MLPRELAGELSRAAASAGAALEQPKAAIERIARTCGSLMGKNELERRGNADLKGFAAIPREQLTIAKVLSLSFVCN
jgi:hypothetical protein